MLTATLTAIAVGIGVPYGVHLVNRLAESLEEAPLDTAVARTLHATGAALTGSALTTLGAFVVLSFSGLPPIRSLGLLGGAGIAFALLAAVLSHLARSCSLRAADVRRRNRATGAPERAVGCHSPACSLVKHVTEHRRYVVRFMRAGLAALALGQLLPGVWALAAPAHFYRRFPGVGPGLVAADGVFNHHLIVDAGAGLAATGAALLLAAAWPGKRVRIVALVAYLTHAVPHLIYHARHVPATLSPAEQTLTWGPLAAGVMLAVGLLTAGGRAGRPASPASPSALQAGQQIPGIQGRPRNLLLLIVFAVARRRLGAVPDSWRVTARVPRVALARAVGDAAHRRTKLVPPRIGALAMLRAATLVECTFCIDIHSAFAPALGVRPEQILHLRNWRHADVFDDDERLALELADAMTATPVRVPDELTRALIDRFGPDGVIELATTVGHENGRARANRVVGVPAQGFAATATCPLPGPVP